VAKPSRRLSGRAKLILLVIVATVLIFGILWFIRYESHGRYLQETNDATIQEDAVPSSRSNRSESSIPAVSSASSRLSPVDERRITHPDQSKEARNRAT
jgi:hypothetical protein